VEDSYVEFTRYQQTQQEREFTNHLARFSDEMQIEPEDRLDESFEEEKQMPDEVAEVP